MPDKRELNCTDPETGIGYMSLDATSPVFWSVAIREGVSLPREHGFLVIKPGEKAYDETIFVQRVLSGKDPLKGVAVTLGGYDLTVWTDRDKKIHHYHLILDPVFKAEGEELRMMSHLKPEDREKVFKIYERYRTFCAPEGITFGNRDQNLFLIRHGKRPQIHKSMYRDGHNTEGRWVAVSPPFGYRIDLDAKIPYFEITAGEWTVHARQGQEEMGHYLIVAGLEFYSPRTEVIHNLLQGKIELGMGEKAFREVVNPYCRLANVSSLPDFMVPRT